LSSSFLLEAFQALAQMWDRSDSSNMQCAAGVIYGTVSTTCFFPEADSSSALLRKTDSALQGCSDTARHVATLLGKLDERMLGSNQESLNSDKPGRDQYIQELNAIPDKHPVLVETFPHGVAFHHAGLHPHMILLSLLSLLPSPKRI